MMIFDEELIPKLCNIHLKQQWAELWKVQNNLKAPIFMDNKNVQEFRVAPIHLAHRMNIVYSQLLKRRLYTKRKPLNPFQVTEAPLSQFMKELKQYVPRYTKKAQLTYLKDLDCECGKDI